MSDQEPNVEEVLANLLGPQAEKCRDTKAGASRSNGPAGPHGGQGSAEVTNGGSNVELSVQTEAVKAATDLAELVRELGVELDPETGNLVGLCPLHTEKSGSFTVYSDQHYHCFGCDAHGDVFDFVRAIRGASFNEAKAWLAQRVGIPLSGSHNDNGAVLPSSSPTERKAKGSSTGDPADKESVLTPSDTGTTAQPSGCTLAAYAKARKLPMEFLSGLGVTDSTYPRRSGNPAVRIPYRDETGQEHATQYRVALQKPEKGPSYLWPKGTKTLLYGLWRRDLAEKSMILVEGPSDCHTLWYHGYNAMGIPGASNFKDARDLESLNPYERIYVVIEPGSSGESLLARIAKSEIRHRVFLVRLDGFKDPSEMHVGDPERFRERFDAARQSALPWHEHETATANQAQAAAWEKCKDLAKQPNILERIAKLVERAGAVGVERIVKLLILILTSRVLERPVSAGVKGPSSVGKSFVIEQVLSAFPPEAYYLLTAMSERALAYSEEPLSNRFLVLIEAGGAGEMANYLLRSLLSEGRLSYETVEKTPKGMRTRRIEREGPTGLLVTTTRTGLHPENETRMFSLTISDTKEQTRLILDALAVDRPSVDFNEARALQEWIGLSDNRVVIPFAKDLAAAIKPVAVRLRRDFRALLSLICAHAILHQATRDRDSEERIVATVDDYAAVRDLVADLVAEGVEATVAPAVRETVVTVCDLALDGGVTAKAVGDRLNIDKGSAQRRCRKAQSLGYLINLEEKKGKPGRYVVGDAMPEDVEILPLPEALDGCTVAVVSGRVKTDTSSLAAIESDAATLTEEGVL